jgi:hypothetical protein
LFLVGQRSFAVARPHVSTLQTESGAPLNQQSYFYEQIEFLNAAIAKSYDAVAAEGNLRQTK